VLMPVCFVPIFRQEMPLEHCLLMALVFAIAIVVLLVINKAPRKILPISRLRHEVAWAIFALLYLVLNLIVVMTGPPWQLVNFAGAYDFVRQEALLYSGNIYAYAYMNLAWALNPFLLAYAIARRNYWLAALASVMEVFLYGYGGFKSVIFVPILVVGSYFAVKHFRRPSTKIILTLTTLTVLTTGAYLRSSSLVNFTINSLYEMRTLGMAGQNAAGFDYFAYNYGFTYWGHLKGINKFVRYDFKQDIGNEVGLIEEGTPTQANTGFLATDGLSAFGFTGVIVIAFVVGAYFWLVDCAASGHDPAFAIAAFSVPAFVLTNGGFFTSLLSAGTLLIVLLLQFMPLVQIAPEESRERVQPQLPLPAGAWNGYVPRI
jgi:oligosaccharide repeat unit polymerase